MKIGIRSICVSKDFEESLALCKKAGMEGIQITANEANIYEASDEELLEFQKHVNDAGLLVASSGAGPNLANPAIREKSLDQFKYLIHAAAVMGVA